MGDAAENLLDGLEERYLKHEKAFESLLALTPAREYYGSQIDDGLEPSEQWNRKKQTKEQKKAAKKAKLDPANQKTALDVMKEREKKRKRELGMEYDEEDVADEAQKPSDNKKQKQELTAEESEAKRQEKADKRRQKREQKKQKVATKKEKADAKKAAKQDQDIAEAQAEKSAGVDVPAEDGESDSDEDDNDQTAPNSNGQPADMEKVDVSGIGGPEHEPVDADEDVDEDEDEDSSAPTSPAVNSPAFDVATNHSEASSSSSIPPTGPEKSNKPATAQQPSSKSNLHLDLSDQKPSVSQKPLPSFTDPASGTSSPKLQLPDIDQAQLQERLRKRIEALRAQRKADGADGKPAKSRQELLEQRRKKEEQRKATKKELRRQAKEDEARKREEQLRGSGSPLSTDIFSRNSPRPQENSFSFSRLAFEDGTAADPSISELRDPKKKKGPQDTRTALLAAEKKQQRLSGLDAEKRADIAEKDMWLNAKKRAHGERVRDDTSLLKKALKRKEKQKSKSEKEWKDREQAVVKGKEAKQKKREANLQKRREEKGQKGKKKPSGGKGKKKARPGFEGRFKA